MSQLNNEGLKLNLGQKFSLGLSSASDFFSIFPTYYQGVSEANNYNYQAWQSSINASLAQQNAQSIIREGDDYINQVREQGKKVRGEQRAAMGASGFEVTSGSYERIINETDSNIERNIAAIRTQTMEKYAAQMTEADMYNIQSDLYKKAAKISKRTATQSAITSGITGALKLGALSYFG